MDVEFFHLLLLALRKSSVPMVVRVLPWVAFNAASGELGKSASNLIGG